MKKKQDSRLMTSDEAKQLFIALKSSGVQYEEIARQTGYSVSMLKKWNSEKDVKEALKKAVAKSPVSPGAKKIIKELKSGYISAGRMRLSDIKKEFGRTYMAFVAGEIDEKECQLRFEMLKEMRAMASRRSKHEQILYRALEEAQQKQLQSGQGDNTDGTIKAQ